MYIVRVHIHVYACINTHTYIHTYIHTGAMQCFPLARSQSLSDPSSLPVTMARRCGRTPKHDISVSTVSLSTKEHSRDIGSQVRKVLSYIYLCIHTLVLCVHGYTYIIYTHTLCLCLFLCPILSLSRSLGLSLSLSLSRALSHLHKPGRRSRECRAR